jgi:hypothetical protein
MLTSRENWNSLPCYYNDYGLKGNIQSLNQFYWRVKQRLYNMKCLSWFHACRP